MKIAVSIPDEIYLQAERLAQQTNRSRSRLYSDALHEYLARHGGNDAVTDALNASLEEIDQREHSFVSAASRVVLVNTEW